MSRSSARGTTEPLVALVAVFAVALGLSLYAGVLDEAFGTLDDDRNRAVPTADTVEQRLSSAGVVHPDRVNDAHDAVADAYRGSVRITVPDDGEWRAGPRPPANADTETRTVSVRIGPGDIRRGTLTVQVWR